MRICKSLLELNFNGDYSLDVFEWLPELFCRFPSEDKAALKSYTDKLLQLFNDPSIDDVELIEDGSSQKHLFYLSLLNGKSMFDQMTVDRLSKFHNKQHANKCLQVLKDLGITTDKLNKIQKNLNQPEKTARKNLAEIFQGRGSSLSKRMVPNISEKTDQSIQIEGIDFSTEIKFGNRVNENKHQILIHFSSQMGNKEGKFDESVFNSPKRLPNYFGMGELYGCFYAEFSINDLVYTVKDLKQRCFYGVVDDKKSFKEKNNLKKDDAFVRSMIGAFPDRFSHVYQFNKASKLSKEFMEAVFNCDKTFKEMFKSGVNIQKTPVKDHIDRTRTLDFNYYFGIIMSSVIIVLAILQMIGYDILFSDVFWANPISQSMLVAAGLVSIFVGVANYFQNNYPSDGVTYFQFSTVVHPIVLGIEYMLLALIGYLSATTHVKILGTLAYTAMLLIGVVCSRQDMDRYFCVFSSFARHFHFSNFMSSQNKNCTAKYVAKKAASMREEMLDAMGVNRHDVGKQKFADKCESKCKR